MVKKLKGFAKINIHFKKILNNICICNKYIIFKTRKLSEITTKGTIYKWSIYIYQCEIHQSCYNLLLGWHPFHWAFSFWIICFLGIMNNTIRYRALYFLVIYNIFIDISKYYLMNFLFRSSTWYCIVNRTTRYKVLYFF